jgi:hypothetical protein
LGIADWLDQEYLALMEKKGKEAWLEVEARVNKMN